MLPQSSSAISVPPVRERPMRPMARKPKRAGWAPEQTLASMGFEGGMGSRGSGENQRGTGNTGGRFITGILPNPARRFLTAGGMPARRRIHQAVGDAANHPKTIRGGDRVPIPSDPSEGQIAGRYNRGMTHWLPREETPSGPVISPRCLDRGLDIVEDGRHSPGEFSTSTPDRCSQGLAGSPGDVSRRAGSACFEWSGSVKECEGTA